MRKKIVGIFVCMLLITTALSTVAIPTVKNEVNYTWVQPSQIHSSGSNSFVYPGGNEYTDYVPGEFIVKFKSEVAVKISKSNNNIVSTGIPSIDALNEKYLVSSVERVFETYKNMGADEQGLHNILKCQVPVTTNIHTLISQYSMNPQVIYVEPNYIIHSCVMPNDPSFNLQYALHNTGQTGGTPDADIDAPEAWDIETGDENIVIAVVDSGVDWDHPDLADNIWVNPGEDLNHNGVVDPSDFNSIDDDSNGFIDDLRGWDFVNTTNPVYSGEDGTIRDNDPMDFHGHGTHCSGIAGAVTNNTIGVAGVCWNCSIMSVRFMYVSKTGLLSGELDDAAAAVMYAADNGAQIMSNSWGIFSYSNLVKDAIDYAYDQGVVLVAGAGNFDVDQKLYPAALDNVIAVAATNHKDERVALSNWGSEFGRWVDVAAPGADIWSTVFNDTYVPFGGTSMATPHVAGVVGLMLSKNPGLNQEEVRTILRSTTDPVESAFYIGTGRINAYNALQRDTSPIVRLNSTLDDAHVSGVLSILGTATGSTFVNYSVWYGTGAYPATWTILQTSSTPVTNGILATLDTASLVEDETYSIQLVVYDSSGHISKDQAVFIKDSEPETGWTVQWTYSYAGPRIVQSQPIGDIDEDEINEVFISSSYEFAHDGVCRILSYNESQATYIEEYSWAVDSLNYWRHPLGVCVIDLDFDGDLEFCLAWGNTYADGIYAYDWDGTTLTQLDRYYETVDYSFGGLSATDYDDDGDVELVFGNNPAFGSGDIHVTALGWDKINNKFVAEAFWTLPGHTDKGCWETMGGDTDNDGKTEVIVTISDWDSIQTAGTWALNWNEDTKQWDHEPVSTDYPTAAAQGLALGDLNGNGIPEIGVGSGNWYGGIAICWLYEWNGTEYKEVWREEYPDEPDIMNAIDIGDADNDGTNELCLGTNVVHMYQWDGTDYREEATLTESRHRLCSLNIGDCDSDGLNEIKTGQRAIIIAGDIGSEFIYKYIPIFDIDIKGGLGVKAVIKNNGTINLTNVSWEIQVTGGILGLINKTVNGIIDIPAGDTVTVKTGLLLGFGSLSIIAKVADEEQTAEGTQLIIFSIVK